MRRNRTGPTSCGAVALAAYQYHSAGNSQLKRTTKCFYADLSITSPAHYHWAIPTPQRGEVCVQSGTISTQNNQGLELPAQGSSWGHHAWHFCVKTQGPPPCKPSTPPPSNPPPPNLHPSSPWTDTVTVNIQTELYGEHPTKCLGPIMISNLIVGPHCEKEEVMLNIIMSYNVTQG